jgi:hypothetical protein
MTLRYRGRLPPGALVRADAATSAPSPSPCPVPKYPGGAGAEPPAPVWFRAAGAGLAPHPADPVRVAAWAAEGGRARAGAVAANRRGTSLDPGPPAALAFAPGVNGGLAVAAAVPEAGLCGFGALLRPDREGAGTILTLAPRTGGYLALSHRDGRLAALLRGGGLDLSLPTEAGWLVVLCGLSDGAVRLSLNGAPAAVARPASAPLPRGPADLFIACRGARPGLTGKLGGFRLTDVFLWPDRDPLAGDGPAPAAVLALWQERRAHGP